jgi:hypothetical protein
MVLVEDLNMEPYKYEVEMPVTWRRPVYVSYGNTCIIITVKYLAKLNKHD